MAILLLNPEPPPREGLIALLEGKLGKDEDKLREKTG